MSFHRYAILCGIACVASPAYGPAAHGQTASNQAQTEQAAQATATLRLEEAFGLALRSDAGLKAAGAARQASGAAIRQADRRPNPTADARVENFGGPNIYQWGNRSETTLSLSQTLELGGDRRARTDLAERHDDSVRTAGDVARQNLLHDVEAAYLDAQRAGAEIVIAKERLAVAREIVTTVARRVEAARDPLMASSRSNAALAEAEIAAERATLNDQAARARLASYWSGDAAFSVDFVAFGQLDGIVPPTAEANNPDLAAALAMQAEADARVAVERARARPDPTVSAGVRVFNDVDEAAFVVGLSIPLPIWDNNGAAVDGAMAEGARARFESEAIRRNLDRQTASARGQLDIARAEITALDARLLPSAEEALSRAREGYAQGGFSYLDVLDAQRVLTDARLQRISALYAFHRARTALTRLLGAYTAQEAPR